MKFNIAVRFDYDKLKKEIEKYIKTYNQDPIILVDYNVFKGMNLNSSELVGNYEHYDGILWHYHGIKVFVDPTLANGEVELR